MSTPEALALADALLDGMSDEHWNQLSADAAALLRTQHKQIAAYKLLTESQGAQLSQHREQADKFREAIATLQSEREANAILTAAIERKDALLRKAFEILSRHIEYDYHGRPMYEKDVVADKLSDAIEDELQ